MTKGEWVMTHHNKHMMIMMKVITIQGLSSMMMITTRTKAQTTTSSLQNFWETKPVWWRQLTSVGIFHFMSPVYATMWRTWAGALCALGRSLWGFRRRILLDFATGEIVSMRRGRVLHQRIRIGPHRQHGGEDSLLSGARRCLCRCRAGLQERISIFF